MAHHATILVTHSIKNKDKDTDDTPLHHSGDPQHQEQRERHWTQTTDLGELHHSGIPDEGAVRLLVASVHDQLRVPHPVVAPAGRPLWEDGDGGPGHKTTNGYWESVTGRIGFCLTDLATAIGNRWLVWFGFCLTDLGIEQQMAIGSRWLVVWVFVSLGS